MNIHPNRRKRLARNILATVTISTLALMPNAPLAQADNNGRNLPGIGGNRGGGNDSGRNLPGVPNRGGHGDRQNGHRRSHDGWKKQHSRRHIDRSGWRIYWRTHSRWEGEYYPPYPSDDNGYYAPEPDYSTEPELYYVPVTAERYLGFRYTPST